VTDLVDTPAVLGAIRPVLLLPQRVCEGSTREQLEHMILHELAHIKRGDLFFSSAEAILCCLFWFHPAVWLAARRRHHLRELCCDATVSTVLKGRTAQYRRALGQAAGQALLPAPLTTLGYLGLVETGSRIRQRLDHLATLSGSSRRWPKIAGVAVAAVILGCIAPMGRQTVGDAMDVLVDASPRVAPGLQSELPQETHPREGFEDSAPGGLPVGWEPNHTLPGGTPVSLEYARQQGVWVEVTDSAAFDGSQSIRFHDTSDRVGAEVHQDFSPLSSVVLEYYMRSDTQTSEGVFVGLEGGGELDYIVGFRGAYIGVVSWTTGWIDTQFLPYTPGTWYKVTRMIDCASNTGSFSVTDLGTGASRSLSIGMAVPAPAVSRIRMVTSNSMGAEAYVDELTWHGETPTETTDR
jgi:hypothetical protein